MSTSKQNCSSALEPGYLRVSPVRASTCVRFSCTQHASPVDTKPNQKKKNVLAIPARKFCLRAIAMLPLFA